MRGWLGYFRLASIKLKIEDIDSWLRNRLRYCIWHHCKKPERKRKNLIRLGVDQNHAYSWSRTRMGGWAVALSPILLTTITLERLRKRGFISFLEHYLKIAPHHNSLSRTHRSGNRCICQPADWYVTRLVYTELSRSVQWPRHYVCGINVRGGS